MIAFLSFTFFIWSIFLLPAKRKNSEIRMKWFILNFIYFWLFRSDRATDFGSNSATLKDTAII